MPERPLIYIASVLWMVISCATMAFVGGVLIRVGLAAEFTSEPIDPTTVRIVSTVFGCIMMVSAYKNLVRGP